MPTHFDSDSQTTTRPTQPARKLKWKRWVLLGLAGVIGYFWWVGSTARNHYEQGTQAYDAGDCGKAIALFDQVIGDRRSSSDPKSPVAQSLVKKADCQAYQAALAPTAQQPATLLSNAATFAYRYPKSGLLQPLRQAIAPVVQQNDAKTFATSNVCGKLDPIQSMNLLPDAPKKLPELYQACGAFFVSTKQNLEVISLSKRFLKEFPDHPLKTSIQQDYARAIVQDAKAQGGSAVPPPERVGSRSDGSTVVLIRNDSPEPLRIAFSGPTARVEEMPACKECQRFTPETAPAACPAKGPTASYTLQPGQYEVMVKATGRGSVKPFTGSWDLSSGEYKNCFYLIQKPTSRS